MKKTNVASLKSPPFSIHAHIIRILQNAPGEGQPRHRLFGQEKFECRVSASCSFLSFPNSLATLVFSRMQRNLRLHWHIRFRPGAVTDRHQSLRGAQFENPRRERCSAARCALVSHPPPPAARPPIPCGVRRAASSSLGERRKRRLSWRASDGQNMWIAD